jgi:uncharacterized protein YdhG (YjbR/CyaY superfamily)
MEKYTTIDEFMNAMDEKQKEQITLLRTIITDIHPELTEHIKWNSPSYVLKGEDRITFSVRPKYPIAIILHMGATRPEDKNGMPVMDNPSGLIEWKSDTRGVISFADLDDIQAKRLQFANIVDQWLSIDA